MLGNQREEDKEPSTTCVSPNESFLLFGHKGEAEYDYMGELVSTMFEATKINACHDRSPPASLKNTYSFWEELKRAPNSTQSCARRCNGHEEQNGREKGAETKSNKVSATEALEVVPEASPSRVVAAGVSNEPTVPPTESILDELRDIQALLQTLFTQHVEIRAILMDQLYRGTERVESSPFSFSWIRELIFGHGGCQWSPSASLDGHSPAVDEGSDNDIYIIPGKIHGECEWRRHLATAMQHARGAYEAYALESLLLAITAENFDDWHSLLVDDHNWNFLQGVSRDQWDKIVASCLSETLRKQIAGKAPLPTEPVVDPVYFGECGPGSNAVQGVNPSRSVMPSPRVIATFIYRALLRHVRSMCSEAEKKRAEMALSHTITPDGRKSLFIPSTDPLILTLETLLNRCTVAFPDSVAFPRTLASLLAAQGREEESLKFFHQVIHLRPTHMLTDLFAASGSTL
ncbi:hypothetical protein TRVL_03160 [Trypanosoma vivax]|nr:hypothetical protein TRVL_03160 [Trypanosoma vivax]